MATQNDLSEILEAGAVLAALLPRPALSNAVLQGVAPRSPQPKDVPWESQPRIKHIDREGLVRAVADFGDREYGYAVTAGLRDLTRYYRSPAHRVLYSNATRVLMRTALCAWVVKSLLNVSLPVCSGADLRRELFANVITFSDRIVVVGGPKDAASAMYQRFGLQNVRHRELSAHSVDDRVALVDCLRYIERMSPFRFCFLSLGSPYDEMIAYCLHARRIARGLAICAGPASAGDGPC